MKPLKFLGTSRKDLKAFGADARQMAGLQLDLVQQGRDPSDWKPMSSVAVGVKEIRIHTKVESRVLYVAKFADAVYVLHAFTKKTQKTEKREIEIAKVRFAELAETIKKERKMK